MKNKISVIGAGLMGSRMAVRLAENGFDVSVFNRTKEKVEHLSKQGIFICQSVNDAVEKGNIIISMLSDYKAINQVLFQDEYLLYTNKTLIQMSTISPDENIKVMIEIEKRGGKFVEAPVLGGITQAQNGELIVMVGADETQFNDLKEIFNTLGNKVKLVGGPGKASALKLSYNQLIATMNAAFCMSLGYALEKEIDVDLFMDILRGSTLYAPAFDKKLANFSKRDYSTTNFSLKLLLKDVNLIVDEFERSRVDCLTLKGVKFLLERGIHFEHGEEDYSSMFEIIYPKK